MSNKTIMETGSLSTLFMRETERHSLLKIFGSRAEVLYANFFIRGDFILRFDQR